MKRKKKFPIFSSIILAIICLGCLGSEVIMNHDPLYLDLMHIGEAPSKEYFFGTDPMGRDIFSMIWYGGRVSLCIGVCSSALSTLIALFYGGISGFSGEQVDKILMRISDLILSIPSILLILFIQGILQNDSALSIIFTIAFTSWVSMAKIVRSEVRQIRNSNYIISARKMGAKFPYLLRVHFFPNIFPSIVFMIVTNVGTAIASEATLSFLGIGLPIEEVSWGTMLSNADQELLSNEW